jgi:hypothetical protein
VVTGLMASYPLGGVGWDYLADVSGFRRLGHQIFYLEGTGQWLYDPRAHTVIELMSRQGAFASMNKTQLGTQEKSQRAVP